MFHPVGESLPAALLPVAGRGALLAEHHRRAVGEEMDGRHLLGIGLGWRDSGRVWLVVLVVVHILLCRWSVSVFMLEG